MLKKIALVLAIVLSMSAVLVNCGPSNPFVTGAKIDMKRGDYEVAKNKLMDALKTNPKMEDATFLLGECYTKGGDYENMGDLDFLKMKEAFDQSLALGVTYKKEIENHTSKAFATVRFAGGKEYNAGVENLKAEAADKAKVNFEKAKKKLEIARKLNANDMVVVKLLANISLQLNDKETAKALYNEALAKDANDVSALKNMAIIYNEDGQEDKSIELYTKITNVPAITGKDQEKEAAALVAAKKDATIKIAGYYEKKEDYAKAIPLYEQILAADPENVNVLFNQGIMFSKQKNFAKAIEVFTKIVKLDDKDIEAKVDLASFYYDNAEYQKVVDYLEPLYAGFSPEYQGKSNDLLFSSFMKLGKGKEAQKYFVK